MKRSRTATGVLLAAAFCALGLARGGELIENASAPGPKTTITYALWGGAGEVAYTRDICRAFVEEHPSIRVRVSVYPWGQYWAKVQTQAAAGLAPDVWSLYSGNMGVWIERGALRPLDDLVKRDGLDLARYHRAAVENCTWDGRLMCMPTEIPVRSLVYSKSRFEERGIPRSEWPRPDRAMSWEAWKRLADRLTLRAPDGGFIQYGMAAGPHWNMPAFRLYGGAFFDRTVNPTRATVTGDAALERAMIELFQTQYGDRNTLGAVPLSSGFVASAESILLSPRFAMCVTGPWALPALREAGVRFGISPLPNAGRPTQLIQVNAVGIFSGSPRVDAAWTFVRFMGSRGVQEILGRRLKGVPALVEARRALIDNEYGIADCEAFLADLEGAEPYLMTADNYVPSELDKWLAQTERALDREYEDRMGALRRGGKAVDEDEYRRFAAGMDVFVADTVRERLPALQAALEAAFRRARPTRAGVAVRTVMPAGLLAVLAFLAAGYVRWIRRRRQAEPMGRRPAGAAAYVFLSPWIIGFVCFMLGPILAALACSFMNWNMIKRPEWIGMGHYLSLLSDRYFLIGLERTGLYVVLAVPIAVLGGLFTAGLLTCGVRGAGALKAIFYFPSLFTGAAAAILWVNMFNREFGVANDLLRRVGLGPVAWLDEGHAFFTVVLMNVFWVGGSMIIYYAGMKQIPESLYESAEIDGAGPMRRFVHITIPMLSPVILFTVVMTTIGAFQIFTPALFFAASSTQVGEPGDALRFYSVNIYNEAFNNLNMGRACCYALVLFVLIFAVTMVQLRASRRLVHTEAET